MHKGDLPKACEPQEEAHQPSIHSSLNAIMPSSQSSASGKCNMSMLPKRERLLWLQQQRRKGLWAQCDNCDRWRYLPHVLERAELPAKWYCKMNPDSSKATCEVEEEPIPLSEEEDLIHSEYSAGSLVWARLRGWPWWPAMVDDCPDTEQYYWLDGFSDIPTHYNVVFLDAKVTRAWVDTKNLKSFLFCPQPFKNVPRQHKSKINYAIKKAGEAAKLELPERLKKFSFITRFEGSIEDTPHEILSQKSDHNSSKGNKNNVILIGNKRSSEVENISEKEHCYIKTQKLTEIVGLTDMAVSVEIKSMNNGSFKTNEVKPHIEMIQDRSVSPDGSEDFDFFKF